MWGTIMTRLRVITFKLSDDELYELDSLVKRLRVNRSDLIRLGIFIVVSILKSIPLYILCSELRGEKQND